MSGDYIPYCVVIDIETTGISPLDHRILTIGVKSEEEEIIFVHQDEKVLLRKFLDWLAETESTVREFQIEPVIITGYNIVGFDIEFLKARCVSHGLPMPNGFQADDMMLRLYPRGWPDCESFDKAAARFGIARTNPLRGADVPRLWVDGRVEDVVAHNLDDIRAEWALWLALQKGKGDKPREP